MALYQPLLRLGAVLLDLYITMSEQLVRVRQAPGSHL
jgi:hypothetical protein